MEAKNTQGAKDEYYLFKVLVMPSIRMALVILKA
jgi:hypothetical protein